MSAFRSKADIDWLLLPNAAKNNDIVLMVLKGRSKTKAAAGASPRQRHPLTQGLDILIAINPKSYDYVGMNAGEPLLGYVGHGRARMNYFPACLIKFT